MKVLAIEDELDDLKLLQHQIKDLSLPECPQIDFDLVTSISAAEMKICVQKYDFIIADFDLQEGVALDFLLAQLHRSPVLYVLLVSNDENLVTLPEVGELLCSERASFCVKSDLDDARLGAEIRAAYGVANHRWQPDTMQKILLVDDDPQELEILEWHCEQIESLKVELERAGNTEEALQKATAADYSLILVDFRLRGERGTDVIEKLQEAGVHCNMFIITDAPSFLGSKEAMRYLGHRRAGFISKRRLGPERILQALQARIQPF